jgi:antitoxin FitA
MAAIIVRNLSSETHRALKLRAVRNRRSTKAEIRAILEEAAQPKDRIKLGSELAAFGRRFGGLDLGIERGTMPSESEEVRPT